MPDTPILELFIHLCAAFGIGLIIGLERGWRQREERSGSRTAGIRTFAVTGLLGGIIGAVAQALIVSAPIAAGIVVAAGFATYSVVIAMFSRDENRAEHTFSATTAIAGMATFALGVYAILGDVRIAAATGVAIAIVLALRSRLHGLIQQLTWNELRSSLVLLAMTFVALPFIPDTPIGPYGGVNLRQIWLVAIALAAVSMIGYGAIRYFGAAYGNLLAALAGGLVSSTAVAVANARRSDAESGHALMLAAGVSIASGISYLRIVAVTAAINPALLRAVAPALVAASIIAGGAGIVLLARRARGAGSPQAKKQAEKFTLKNPFRFWPVVAFAVFLGAVSLLGKIAADALGAGGVIGGAVLIGFADVDSVALSMSNLALDPAQRVPAGIAILAAAASNTLTKAAIAAAFGSRAFAFLTIALSCGALAAAGLVLMLDMAANPA